MNKPEFEVELIDFTIKRLNLEHKPRIQSTHKVRRSYNAFGQNILNWSKSLIPQALQSK